MGAIADAKRQKDRYPSPTPQNLSLITCKSALYLGHHDVGPAGVHHLLLQLLDAQLVAHVQQLQAVARLLHRKGVYV